MTAEVGILNVGAGDTKLVFDVKDPDAMKKAARIVTDMIRRGYVLMIETKRKTKAGEPIFQRVRKFKANTCEYIISDIGGDDEPAAAEGISPTRAKTRGTLAISAAAARAVAIPRSAGG